MQFYLLVTVLHNVLWGQSVFAKSWGFSKATEKISSILLVSTRYTEKLTLILTFRMSRFLTFKNFLPEKKTPFLSKTKIGTYIFVWLIAIAVFGVVAGYNTKHFCTLVLANLNVWIKSTGQTILESIHHNLFKK